MAIHLIDFSLFFHFVPTAVKLDAKSITRFVLCCFALTVALSLYILPKAKSACRIQLSVKIHQRAHLLSFGNLSFK